jgi:2-phospho-L-lactate guanylyltransferase
MIIQPRPVIVAVPVKPFDAAKARLASLLSPASRRWLGRGLAERTLSAVAAAGATPLVLAADDEVAGWAVEAGVEVLLDRGSSLDRAAADAVALAAERTTGWIVCHADLPLLAAGDLTPAVTVVARGGAVIAPSADGGTSLLGCGLPAFPFAYGPGSFHRHLAAAAHLAPIVLVTPGLACDLDLPADLVAVRRHPRGRWLAAAPG